MQFALKEYDQPLALRGKPECARINIKNPPALPSICPSGLLKLPYEIRQTIWLHVLRPDCRMTERHMGQYICEKKHQHAYGLLGCTNVLRVCSQIYHEAIELLHGEERVIKLDGHYNQLLRGPLEFGKPSYFKSSKNTHKC